MLSQPAVEAHFLISELNQSGGKGIFAWMSMACCCADGGLLRTRTRRMRQKCPLEIHVPTDAC